MAYGRGPYQSVAYLVELTESSARRLGLNPNNRFFTVTYQMLNVQKASHEHLLEFNRKMGFSVEPDVLHVGAAVKSGKVD